MIERLERRKLERRKKLPAAIRADLQPGLDPAALEKLVAHVHPGHRSDLLTAFTNEGGVVLTLGSPVLDRLLEDVYAPRFSDHSEGELRQMLNSDPDGPAAPGIRGQLRRREYQLP